MKLLDIHPTIKERLLYFIKKKKIPNIIFNGPNGGGKRHVLRFFLDHIYNVNQRKYILLVNCAHSRGIRFFRDELKFFAKTNISNNDGIFFKSIILLQADKLTADAQSALRRCIEKYSHSTRFFIIVENKNKLLKPIKSRFCDIYIPKPLINGKQTSLHLYHLEQFKKNKLDIREKNREKWFLKQITNKKHFNNLKAFILFVNKLYERGYYALYILNFIKREKIIIKDDLKRAHKLYFFDIIRKEFRDEKTFMAIILYFIFLRPNFNLENVQIM